MLPLLTFHPILKERVWGGRKLEQLYHKSLPPGVPIGESWEISDRPGDVSTVANGPLAGKDLHWLIEHDAQELLGPTQALHGRFPLLVKILDSEEKLSLQVHPPPEKGRELGGEPKTEMWFIAQAAPGAELFVGLKRGVTREEFERKIRSGNVEECVHRIKVKAGDAMFLPSGRVHAIGAGLVIFEIQQNSDTTYRVFDWNRLGLDGKPRTMHIAESLASINFDDFEPPLIRGDFTGEGPVKVRSLVSDKLFTVELYEAAVTGSLPLPANRLQILGVTSGHIDLSDDGPEIHLTAGGFSLIPASARQPVVRIEGAASFLRIEPGADSANS
jgi:mannose-6-phosphate isomerase